MSTTPIGKVESLLGQTARTTPVTNENPLPGMVRKGQDPELVMRQKQRVRFQRFNMSDPGDMAELERIETKAWRGQGTYLIEEKNYIFMDVMYYLIKYIEDAE